MKYSITANVAFANAYNKGGNHPASFVNTAHSLSALQYICKSREQGLHLR